MRLTARGILRNKNTNKFLLIKYLDTNSISTKEFNEGYWIFPGGGLEEKESFNEGLKREIYEETGIENIFIGNCVFSRVLDLQLDNIDTNFFYERYYIVETYEEIIKIENLEEKEKEVIIDYKWWDINEINSSKEVIFPLEIKDLLKKDFLTNKYPIDISNFK